MTLLWVLLVLFVVLALLVIVLEKRHRARGEPDNSAAIARMSRWVLPLMALLAVLQLIRHYWG